MAVWVFPHPQRLAGRTTVTVANCQQNQRVTDGVRRNGQEGNWKGRMGAMGIMDAVIHNLHTVSARGQDLTRVSGAV